MSIGWIEPMLATLTERQFSDPAWIFERKLDGERCLAIRHEGELHLYSRNQQHLDNVYPEVLGALTQAMPLDGVIDGEIVTFEGQRTSFERLQQRIGLHHPSVELQHQVPVFYYVFDAPMLDVDLRKTPLLERKERLSGDVDFADPLRYTPHRARDGEVFYAEACAADWEGLIAKLAESPYRSGRSKDWLKFKCSAAQEFVVVGYTAPKGNRVGLGALLVGYFEDGELRYAGKVGTGFDTTMLRDLRTRLEPLAHEGAHPLRPAVRERGARLVEPALVAEVAFSEWTRDGKLRHPRFLGLRDDKDAADVIRERPA